MLAKYSKLTVMQKGHLGHALQTFFGCQMLHHVIVTTTISKYVLNSFTDQWHQVGSLAAYHRKLNIRKFKVVNIDHKPQILTFILQVIWVFFLISYILSHNLPASYLHLKYLSIPQVLQNVYQKITPPL